MLGEFIGEILIEGLLGYLWHGIKASIGFVYLYLRYWRPRRVREQLTQHYGSRYATAGSAVLTGLMQGLGVALLLALGAALLLGLGAALVTATRHY